MRQTLLAVSSDVAAARVRWALARQTSEIDIVGGAINGLLGSLIEGVCEAAYRGARVRLLVADPQIQHSTRRWPQHAAATRSNNLIRAFRARNVPNLDIRLHRFPYLQPYIRIDNLCLLAPVAPISSDDIASGPTIVFTQHDAPSSLARSVRDYYERIFATSVAYHDPAAVDLSLEVTAERASFLMGAPHVEPPELESIAASFFSAIPFLDLKLENVGPDAGFDLLLWNRSDSVEGGTGNPVAVQTKVSRKPLGVQVIRDLVTTARRLGLSVVFLISNQTLTSAAKREVETAASVQAVRIIFLDLEDLASTRTRRQASTLLQARLA